MSHAIDMALRRKALRLWTKGAPRKMIALLTGLDERTIKRWRYDYQWPARKSYKSRPQTRAWKREKPQREAIISGECTFGCPRCSFRASDPKGHPACNLEVA